MSRGRIGVAAGSKLGADAAVEIARAGGNAVDACIAAAIAAWVAEPFFASLGGSGFIGVRAADGRVEMFDGNNAMPVGAPRAPGQGLTRVYLEYSNGMYTGVGGGSVAVPGILAAMRAAWERHGSIEWSALFHHAIAAARAGIVFPRTSAYYLSLTWGAIWSREQASRRLFGSDQPVGEGTLLVQPELAETLATVADQGPQPLYGGELGRDVAEAIAADNGLLTLRDLETYEAVSRAPIATEVFGWRVECNPPPASGGVALAHMLALLDGTPLDGPVERLRSILGAERAATGHPDEGDGDPAEVLDAAEQGAWGRGRGSASTTHSSAAGSDGVACSITESTGYGSGVVVHGILLNNTLGEEELNPLGVHGLAPGTRCHSNMAPTIATREDRVVALGSPGADRIVGAVAQTLLAIALDGRSLAEAVSAPRAHLARRPEGEIVCFEPGLPGRRLGLPTLPYDDLHMFFGAVQAASVARDGEVDAAHDPRRSGASAIV